ncbi:MAG: hypothetical protein HRT38_05775 [Alteromonadaceae bacterium]|nr:hypothetical protein [Alteromonadaceae bacterium]
MNDLWVPIVLTICLTIILTSYFYFSHKNKTDIQQTIREALNKGCELTPEHIAQMNNTKPTKTTDLRRGILLLSFGIAALLGGFIIGNAEDAAAFAMFPLLLGCGFLTTWKLSNNDA